MTIITDDKIVNCPLVSIVIPSYNRENTVGHTIDSIMSQICNFDFEIVIGDDFSADNARAVLIEYQKKYPNNISLYFYDSNIGLGANWATCVKQCRGKYLANCDNDDYWHNPHKLQLQVDFLESHTEYGVCHTDFRCHNRLTGKILEIIVSTDIFDMPLHKAIFSGKFRFCNATMMYRKELIDKYVNLDDYIRYQFTLQDWNTWIILAKYTSFYCLPISTATFGTETESITRPKDFEKLKIRFKKEKECYKYVCEMFPDDLPFDDKGYDIYVNKVLLNLAFRKTDFKSAQIYGNILKDFGINSFKTKSSTNIMYFYLMCIFLKIKKKF